MSKKQIPRGPEDKACPLWQRPMEEVCHKCEWWTPVNMVDPNHVQTMPPTPPPVISEYRCAVSWIPTLLMEIGRQQLSTAAATESVREEMKKSEAQASVTIGTLTTMLNKALDVPRAPQLANGHVKQITAD